MVREFVVNLCTNVKVDEATDYRTGASNREWFTGSEGGQLLKSTQRTETQFYSRVSE
jgi:hypothetical protein